MSTLFEGMHNKFSVIGYTTCKNRRGLALTDKEKNLAWWQLALIGVGCTIGTGFFLGSAIAIQQGGPAVVALFFIGAVATYIVYDALSILTANDPQEGSFRTYAKNAFGSWAGFSNGWVYWSSEMLIMGSQLTAISIFAQFWFPSMPIWMLSVIFGSLGVAVILLGVSGFEKAENIFGMMKIAAIIMFIIIGFLVIFGVIKGDTSWLTFTKDKLLPKGTIGIWTAFIYVLYAYGGIEVMGIMANELKEPKDAPKSGKVMLGLLSCIYIISIGLCVWLLPIKAFNGDKSPFLLLLEKLDLTIITHMFNGILIIGGFSTMVASLYGITTILTNLSEDGDAPKLFSKKGKRNVPYYAVALTTSGLVLSIVIAFLIPDKVYEYITTAASLMLIYIWIFILFTYSKLSKLTVIAKWKQRIGVLLLAVGVLGTLFDAIGRIGLLISGVFLTVISVVTIIVQKKQVH